MSFLDPYPVWPLLLALFVGAILLLSRKRKRRDPQRRRQDARTHQDGGTYVADGGTPSGGRKDMPSDSGHDTDGGSTDGGGGDGGGGGGGD